MKMKRWLSVLLAVVLLVCAVPMTASAAEALVAGTPLAVVPGAELTEVTFTPTETGVYSLASSYDDPSQSASPYLEGVYAGEDNVYEVYGGSGWFGVEHFYYVYMLAAGETYTFKFGDYSQSAAGYTVTLAQETIEEFTADAPKTVIPGDKIVFLSFTPDETDTYAFKSDAVTDADPFLRDFRDAEGEYVEYFYGETDDYDGFEFFAVYELEAGVTYTLMLYDYNSTTDGFVFSLTPFYAVLEQPTAADPTVVVSKEEDVESYQWYDTESEEAPLTPDNPCVDYYNDYDEEHALWIGSEYGNDGENYSYSVLDLHMKVGEMLTITATDPIVEANLYAWVAGVSGTVTVVDEYTVKMLCTEEMYYTPEIITEGNAGTFQISMVTVEIGDAIAGQTTATLTESEREEIYTCVVTYEDGTEVQSVFVMMAATILKQPTAKDPTVEVTFADEVESYQWYATDAELSPVLPEDVVDDSDYNEATGKWEPAAMGYISDTQYEYQLFDIELTEGQTLYVQSDDEFLFDYSYISGSMDGAGSERVNANTVSFTAPVDDTYTVWVTTDTDVSTFTARTGSIEIADAIEGETAATLSEIENGAWYVCEITYEDGSTLTSDFMEMKPVVTKQPTAAAPSVEVNLPDDVEGYQWYELQKTPITDEDVEDVVIEDASVDIVSGTYDADTDTWTPGLTEDTLLAWFAIELNKGDILCMEIEGDEPFGLVMGDVTADPVVSAQFENNGDDLYVATAPVDGTYIVIGIVGEDANIRTKVWKEHAVAVAGQTAAALTACKAGTEYYCEITLKDGGKLVSDRMLATATTELALKLADLDTTDRAALEAALEEIEALLEADDLTDAEEELLVEMQGRVKAAIAALPQPETPDKNEGANGGPGSVETPDMGDHNEMRVWMAILLVASLSVLTLVSVRRKTSK